MGNTYEAMMDDQERRARKSKLSASQQSEGTGRATVLEPTNDLGDELLVDDHLFSAEMSYKHALALQDPRRTLGTWDSDEVKDVDALPEDTFWTEGLLTPRTRIVRGTESVLGWSVVLLPKSHRERYWKEWRAELAHIGSAGGQVRFVLGLVKAAPVMRIAIRRQQVRTLRPTDPDSMSAQTSTMYLVGALIAALALTASFLQSVADGDSLWIAINGIMAALSGSLAIFELLAYRRYRRRRKAEE